ncbi:MAG: GntR family transcriptional regulator [Chitinivibrionales bacterium]|nr:GntR family transcriptional regulator [Chitinivibrionales bacterium]
MGKSRMPADPLTALVSDFVRKGPPGAMLPSDRELAQHLGLSRITIQRKMAALARQGTIERIQGKGSFVPGRAVGERRAVARKTESVQRLVDHIVAAVGRGELTRGNTLPSYKEMCAFFAVSPATVRAAYRILEDKRMVARVGRYYQVGSFNSIMRTGMSRDVYLFAPEPCDIQKLFSENELALSFAKMEHELHVHGYTVHYRTYDQIDSELDTWIQHSHYPCGLLFTGTIATGYVMPDEPMLSKPLNRLFKKAKGLRPRVVVTTTCFCYPDPRVISFSVTHAVTAMKRRLATFLFKNQYRRVTAMLDDRYTSPPVLVDDLRVAPELDNLDPAIELTFAVRTADLQGFIDGCARWGSAEMYTSRLSKYRAYTFDELTSRFRQVDSLEEMCARSQFPCVWLFNHDDEAARALEWCDRHGVAVPEQASIISFENSHHYNELGITSCVRDWETIGYLMAHALISDIPLQKTRQGYVRLPALLFERRTSVRSHG